MSNLIDVKLSKQDIQDIRWALQSLSIRLTERQRDKKNSFINVGTDNYDYVTETIKRELSELVEQQIQINALEDKIRGYL